MAVDGVVVDTTNVAGVEDGAIQCSTTTRTPTITTIGRTAMATLHINQRHISNAIHISLSRDIVVTIRALDLHQTMAEQHIILVEVLRVEVHPL